MKDRERFSRLQIPNLIHTEDADRIRHGAPLVENFVGSYSSLERRAALWASRYDDAQANGLHKCTADHLAPGLWEALGTLKEMVEHAEKEGRPLQRQDLTRNPHWRSVLNDHVRQHGHGVYAIRYLHPDFCAKLLKHFELYEFKVNEAEPVDAQIPELTLGDNAHAIFSALHGMFTAYVELMVAILFGLKVGEVSSIQAARYTPSTVPKGCWHVDEDSEMTLVVALSDEHEGGGTWVHNGPFSFPTLVPQLETGWAMLFSGRTRQHMGAAVTKGQRNLLVHWYNLERDEDDNE